MYSQKDWIGRFKTSAAIRSDYKLAKVLNVPPNYIPALRSGRLRLRLHNILQIAEQLEIEPLEIIVSLEFPRCREHERERLIDWYFSETVKTIGVRMSAQSMGSYHPRCRAWR